MREVILINGKRVPMAEWQELYNLDMYQLSKTQDLINEVWRHYNTYSEPLLVFIDRLAQRCPLKLNVTLRRHESEKYSYCTTEGLFIDIEYSGDAMRGFLKNNIEKVKKECQERDASFNIRYKFGRLDFSSLYIDVAPMYYGWGKPYANEPHDEEWEHHKRVIPKQFKNHVEQRTTKKMYAARYGEEY